MNFTHMKTYITLLILCVVTFTGCSLSGPPESLIKANCEDLNGQVGVKYEFVSAERGSVIESDGRYGTKGTKAYPVRVHWIWHRLSDGNTSDNVDDCVYYKDVFGDWQRGRYERQ